MAKIIFYSWQSDIEKRVCRNFIQSALQSALDRLHAELEIEDADRLHLDHDTKDVPGTPNIFETIRAKIAASSIFVADLTFVGNLMGGERVSNPNVLIEYGLALAHKGDGLLIGVMNEAFGVVTESDMPFNLRHKRFPIRYSLTEGAGQEERSSVRKALVRDFEAAVKAITASTIFKSSTGTEKVTASDISARYKENLDYEAGRRRLARESGYGAAARAAEALIDSLFQIAHQIESRDGLGIEVGKGSEPNGRRAVSLRLAGFGMILRWEPVNVGSSDNQVIVETFRGHIFLPGESLAGVHLRQPQLIAQSVYMPTAAGDVAAWALEGSTAPADQLLSADLADDLMTSFLHYSLGPR